MHSLNGPARVSFIIARYFKLGKKIKYNYIKFINYLNYYYYYYKLLLFWIFSRISFENVVSERHRFAIASIHFDGSKCCWFVVSYCCCTRVRTDSSFFKADSLQVTMQKTTRLPQNKKHYVSEWWTSQLWTWDGFYFNFKFFIFIRMFKLIIPSEIVFWKNNIVNESELIDEIDFNLHWYLVLMQCSCQDLPKNSNN